MSNSYELSKLNPFEFENMTNALAIEVLGNGVTTFGPGPDGGRDGLFEGKALYPSEAENWDGIWYIQSKFHKPHLSKDPQKWIFEQVKEEIKEFLNSGRQWPNNWIIATNIDLSGKKNSGSFDMIKKLIKDANPILANRFDIWGGEKIISFLNKYPNIAERYGHFLTPGNILSDLRKSLDESRASHKDIFNYLTTRNFDEQRYTKLDQAGSASDTKPSIHSVFVDIPFQCFDFKIKREMLYENLNSASSECHKNSDLNSDWVDWTRHPKRSSVWIVKAGPGSGKSTLCQLFCQIQRAALILMDNEKQVPNNLLEELNNIKNFAEEKGWWPNAPRLPIFIELKDYAFWFTSKGPREAKGVLTYVAETMSKQLGETVHVGTLKKALKNGRWAVIFDGLDEVPQDCKNELSKEVYIFTTHVASEQNCDLFTVCTTRPQGYSGQFDTLKAPYVDLVHLSEIEALNCAIPIIKISRTNEESQKAISNLTSALKSSSVQELMKTPLQCHIMAVIVRDGQRPPNRRWKLFANFYEVIKRREGNRDLPDVKIARLLREQDKLLKSVHSRVGFSLHTLAETSKGATTSLPKTEFKKLVIEAATFWEDVDIEETSETLVEATIDRLVLINTPDDGNNLRFDVRQLQEFFAAEFTYEAIEDDDLRERFSLIAGDQHWREVVHFLLSALIENDRGSDLVDATDILNEINSSDKYPIFYKRLAEGSRIVFRLFQEGVLDESPIIRRKFAHILKPYFAICSRRTNEDFLAIQGKNSQKWIIDLLVASFLELDANESIGAGKILFLNLADDHPQRAAVEQKFKTMPSNYIDYIFTFVPNEKRFYRYEKLNIKTMGNWAWKIIWERLSSTTWKTYKNLIRFVSHTSILENLNISNCNEDILKLLTSQKMLLKEKDIKGKEVEIDYGLCRVQYGTNWTNMQNFKATDYYSLSTSSNLTGYFLILSRIIDFIKLQTSKSLKDIFKDEENFLTVWKLINQSDISFFIPAVGWGGSSDAFKEKIFKALADIDDTKFNILIEHQVLDNMELWIPSNSVMPQEKDITIDQIENLYVKSPDLTMLLLARIIFEKNKKIGSSTLVSAKTFFISKIKDTNISWEKLFNYFGDITKILSEQDKDYLLEYYKKIFSENPKKISSVWFNRELEPIVIDFKTNSELLAPTLISILITKKHNIIEEDDIKKIINKCFPLDQCSYLGSLNEFQNVPATRGALLLLCMLKGELEKITYNPKEICNAICEFENGFFVPYLINIIKETNPQHLIVKELIEELLIIYNDNFETRELVEDFFAEWRENSSQPITKTCSTEKWFKKKEKNKKIN